MTWNWAGLVAALLAAVTALYIRLRWRRAPQAFTAMVAVAMCCFVTGAVLGGWVVHLLGASRSRSAPSPGEQPTAAPAQPSPIASSAAIPNLPASTVPPAGYNCGTGRWPVKTLSDEDRDRVNLKPAPSTVA